MSIFEKSKWIWPGETASLPNQYCQFIHIFNLDNIEKNAFINISAASNYALYINGEFVDGGQYHDYPECKSYDTLSVSSHLVKGENRLCVLGYNMGSDTFSNIKDTAGIIYELVNGNDNISSGYDCLYRVSPDYRQGEMEVVSPQLGWTFAFDGTKYDSWTDKEYICGNDWTKISEKDIMDKTDRFFPRPVAKLKQIANIYPEITACGSFIRKNNEGTPAQLVYFDFLGTSILEDKIPLPNNDFHPKKEDGTDGVYYVIDMGAEVAGNVCLEIDAEKGTYLDVGYGEQLDDLRVRSFIACRHFGFRYYAKEGENRFIHRFLRVAGRYLQIHVTGNAFIKNACIIPTDYYAPLKSSYESVNKLENKINEVAVRTLRVCMHEHFEDTPWREQGLYGMDSRNQALCNYYAFGDYNFVKSCLKTFAKNFGDDGFFEITSPAKYEFTIPSFTFAWVMMIKDYLMYSGDYDFVWDMMVQMKDIFDKILEKTDDTGLLPTIYDNRYWHFTEWSDGLDGSRSTEKAAGDYSLPFNAFFAMALESFIDIQRFMNLDPGDYKKILSKLKKSANKMFWSSEKQYYRTYIGGAFPDHYSQLAGALALLAGFVPKERQDKCRSKIAYDKSLTECTLSMCLYKYEALLADKNYADVVFDEIEKIWGDMVYSGLTTFPETVRRAWDFGKAGSHSHAWSAFPIYLYYAYLLGVKPTKPGFAEYEVKPVKKSYVKAEIFTPQGYIKINTL